LKKGVRKKKGSVDRKLSFCTPRRKRSRKKGYFLRNSRTWRRGKTCGGVPGVCSVKKRKAAGKILVEKKRSLTKGGKVQGKRGAS